MVCYGGKECEKMKTKAPSIFTIVLLVLLVSYLIIPWGLIAIGSILSPNPPRPEIKYGEFPFKLVYEINGEQKTIEDTLICEYDGLNITEAGKYLKWKRRLFSGHNGIVLLKMSIPADKDKSGRKVVSRSIVYWLGPTEYYMGAQNDFEYTFPDAGCYYELEDGTFRNESISATELLEKYAIKLISWDIEPPIQNRFM